MNRTRGKIRPPRRGLATDPVDFDEYWDVLATSLREIHAKNASRLSFEELYRNAYKLVLKKHGERLYANVKQLVVEHLRIVAVRDVKPLVPSAIVTGNASFGTASVEKRMDGTKFLDRLKAVWEDHQLCMGMMKDVLMYMDRVFCADHKIPSIYVTCMGLFRDHILRNPQYNIGKALNTVILDQIKMERDGDIIDHATIRSCVYMLEALYENEDENENEKIYLTSFEDEFLKASAEFYKQEGNRLLRECDAATYLRKTDKRLHEEYSRSHDTLSTLTEPKIRAVVEREMIGKNIKEVLEMEGSGLRFMLDNDRFNDLKLVYRLISRVDPNKTDLKMMMCARLVELGTEINESVLNPPAAAAIASLENGDVSRSGAAAANEDRAANNMTMIAIRWVDEVIALKDKYERIWEQSFEKDKGIQTAMTLAFAKFINLSQRSPEYMSLFIDDNLRKGLKGKTELEVDVVLDKAITLFRYVQDKDVFERYYKKHLSRRLLMNRSVSQDAEKQMISKLKIEAGFAFTNKLEGMFKDMNISEEMTSEFKKLLQKKSGDDDRIAKAKRIDLSVNVLTSTFWPLASMGADGMNTCAFPAELETLKETFTGYYLGRHSGRKLSWQANMGTADLKTQFKGVKKDLNVSTYAMVVLLLFNDIAIGESISFQDIQTITNIPPSELIRTLQSLAVAPKTRILNKLPMSKDVRPTDVFAVNEKFTSKFTKIKVGMVSANRAESEKERKDTNDKVDETRGLQIEAAVVRIMKQRKVLSHAELVSEVISQLKGRFNPDVGMIKKRVESLMEREYIERVEGERQTYKYLA